MIHHDLPSEHITRSVLTALPVNTAAHEIPAPLRVVFGFAVFGGRGSTEDRVTSVSRCISTTDRIVRSTPSLLRVVHHGKAAGLEVFFFGTG